MLAELVDHVIGIDPDKERITAAVIDAKTTGVVATEVFAATRGGYRALVEFADDHTEVGERAFVIEGTRSYGAGVTAALQGAGEWVLEFDRSKEKRRGRAKSDVIDAVEMAREALGRERLAEPRSGGTREAIRVHHVARESAVRARTAAINAMKAMVLTAPEGLRGELRGLRSPALVRRCAGFRDAPSRSIDERETRKVLRALSERIAGLDAEIAAHEAAVRPLLLAQAPQVLAQVGVGEWVTAQVLISWSHPGRCRSEAAFANLGGSAPIEASSGQTVRRRLNRGGDRQLNRALDVVARTRMRCDERTRAYVERRTAEGKSDREIRRCLKRYIARQMFRLLENGPNSHGVVTGAA
jgi:transposase